MSRHVDRHAVYLDGEIGAVVKVDAAQKILVGFALSGMLGDDQPGHDLQSLTGPQERDGIHFRATDTYGAGAGRLQHGRLRGRARCQATGADCRLIGNRDARSTVSRRLWTGGPLGRGDPWSRDIDRRKNVSVRTGNFVCRGREHAGGARYRGGRYTRQDTTHRKFPACS